MRHFILLCFVSTITFAPAADAHPHAWILIRTTVILNNAQEAIALREHWLFDKMYSAYATADFNPHKNGTLLDKDLQTLAEQNVHNLKDYDYFTVLEDHNANPLRFLPATDITSSFETPPSNNNTPSTSPQQIAMTFTVPLATPINLRKGQMVYRIFDPTYYTDIKHVDQNPVTLIDEKSGTETTTCSVKIEHPQVDERMIFSAAALDKSATAPDNLGYYFSQKVTVSCP